MGGKDLVICEKNCVVESNDFVECFTLSDLIASGGLDLSPALGSSGATVSFDLSLVASHERGSFDLNKE